MPANANADLSCTKCGGPLPIEAARVPVTCAFCGTTSVPPPQVVAVGRVGPIEIPTGITTDDRLPCPRCGDYLTETRIQDRLALCACKGCGGVWLDASAVNRLRQNGRDEDVEQGMRRIANRVISSAAPDRNVSIACPVCRKHLRRAAIPSSNHVIDICDAHGTWFDRPTADDDELRSFFSPDSRQ